jgi:DnaJ-class molecular chaperone
MKLCPVCEGAGKIRMAGSRKSCDHCDGEGEVSE